MEEKKEHVVSGEKEGKDFADEINPELEALLQTDPLSGLSDSEVTARLLTWGTNGNSQ